MSINKWRNKGYTDEGCNQYQCLSCYEDWEGRSSPEYGWNYCPYCGTKWEGEVKCRPSYTPRWQWSLIPQRDHARYDEIQDLVEANRVKVEGRVPVWVIEYRTINEDKWFYENAFSISPWREPKVPARIAALRMKNDARDLYAAESLSCKKEFGFDLQDEPAVREWRDSLYPEREWRIRIISKSEFQKLYRTYINMY